MNESNPFVCRRFQRKIFWRGLDSRVRRDDVLGSRNLLSVPIHATACCLFAYCLSFANGQLRFFKMMPRLFMSNSVR
jgi:hypothetical protein